MLGRVRGQQGRVGRGGELGIGDGGFVDDLRRRQCWARSTEAEQRRLSVVVVTESKKLGCMWAQVMLTIIVVLARIIYRRTYCRFSRVTQFRGNRRASAPLGRFRLANI